MIYKYRTVEVGLKILKNQSIRFSSPSEFSDIMDVAPSLIDFQFRLNDKIGDEQKRDLEILFEKRPDLKIKTTQNERLISEAYQDMLIKKNKILKICSFSTNGNSSQLWENYGDSEKGIVLGFEPDLQKKFLSESPEFFFGGLVEYVDAYPTIKYQVSPKEEIYSSWVRTKLKNEFHWEEEYRIGFFKNDLSLLNVKVIEVKFDPASLLEIRFGKLTSKSDKDQIFYLLGEKGWSHVKLI